MSAWLEGSTPLEEGLNLVEVAKHLNMSLGTVSRWASSGRIPSAVAPSGVWQCRLKDLDTVSVPGTEPGGVTPAG